jgi:hypothetical protein
VTTKLEFLADHPIFADLYDDELLALNQLAQEYAFEPRAVIAYQRDIADSMYLVRDGRLFANGFSKREAILPRSLEPTLVTSSFSEVRIFANSFVLTPRQSSGSRPLWMRKVNGMVVCLRTYGT